MDRSGCYGRMKSSKCWSKWFFSFVPIIDMVLTHKSKHCCKRRAYGVIGNASSQQNMYFCKIHKENLDLMNMYCLYGIFPWPTSWKLLWHDGNQHLLNYDTWLVVHACMHDLCSLFAPHVISPHHRCQILVTKHFILYYLSKTPIINKMHVKRWVRNQNTYQNSKGEKNNQPKPYSGKLVQNRIWPKGKLARKMLNFDHQYVSFEWGVIIIACGFLSSNTICQRQVSQKKVQVMHLVFPTTSWRNWTNPMGNVIE